jgi:S-DNA-T family DNA segregation ATPase FtsK/SpoIIIE
MTEKVILKHKRKKKDKDEKIIDEIGSPDFKKIRLRYKIISVLLTIISMLVFLALVSYNPLDESTAQFTIMDYFGLIGGDEVIVGQAAQVHNWLGVIGAMISYGMYNNTIGYSIIIAPIFVFLWARELLTPDTIRKSLPRYTVVYLLVGIMFATLMGAFQQFEWGAAIPGEWSGAIGLFLGSVLSAILSPVGAVVVAVLGFGLTFVLGIDVSRDKIKSKIKEALKDDDEEEVEISKPAPAKEKVQEKPDEINIRNLDELDKEKAERTKKEAVAEEEKEETPQAAKKNDDDEDFVIDIADIADDNPVSSFETGKSREYTSTEETGNEPEEEDFDEEDFDNELPKPEFTKSASDEVFDKEEESEDSGFGKPASPFSPLDSNSFKPLTVEVEDTDDDFNQGNFSLPSTAIHDEEINYEFPSFELLDRSRDDTRVNDQELKKNSQIIRETFETFKILIERLKVTPGPVVTQYEFVPARGVKVSKINNYADDVAMALKARGIRIIAPIPGKGTVGIEIPNSKRTMIRFHDVANTLAFSETKAKLPLALGKTISGETYITDLAKMPHLLIAGTTGAGKSVGMNTIICSLLYKMHPSDLKMVIIDPKRVEMNQYSDLSHLFLASSPDVKSDSLIINDPEDAIAILQSTVKEMENRYKILENVRLKSISEYNSKIEKGGLKDDSGMEHRKMPYLVVIVDELADLMMSGSKKEIEFCITRLAQMARAVGIHLVLATQRPSTDVITGLIKANFPARIAYTVNSGIDSRTILDQTGAEKLIGYGDMLCMPPGIASPVRVQNAFIDTDEIEGICEHMLDQEGYSMPYMLPSAAEKDDDGDYYTTDPEDRDALFGDAARLVVENQIASVSMVQRRLKVGYARAGRIIDQLEEAGIVGKFKGSKSREVLLSSTSDLESIL